MIRVLIVEDVTVIRNGLAFILKEDPEIEVAGMASNGEEAIKKCIELVPDVILMDLKMPVCDGVEATKKIRETFPNVKILILTTFKDEENVKSALANGANGYILKDIDTKELISVIKSTYGGIFSMHQDILGVLAGDINEKRTVKDNKPAALDVFTDKEKSIIRMMVDGKSYKQISAELFLSEGAIRNIISDLLNRLNLKDRIQLAVYAIKNDLL
ncbi:MAG TPA: response regulator transcription factor [Clostridia bacterium]